MLLKSGFNNAERDSAIYLRATFVAITSNLFYADIGKDKLLVAGAISMLGRNTAALLSNASVHTQENLQGAVRLGSHFTVLEMKALIRFKPNLNKIHLN